MPRRPTARPPLRDSRVMSGLAQVPFDGARADGTCTCGAQGTPPPLGDELEAYRLPSRADKAAERFRMSRHWQKISLSRRSHVNSAQSPVPPIRQVLPPRGPGCGQASALASIAQPQDPPQPAARFGHASEPAGKPHPPPPHSPSLLPHGGPPAPSGPLQLSEQSPPGLPRGGSAGR